MEWVFLVWVGERHEYANVASVHRSSPTAIKAARKLVADRTAQLKVQSKQYGPYRWEIDETEFVQVQKVPLLP